MSGGHYPAYHTILGSILLAGSEIHLGVLLLSTTLGYICDYTKGMISTFSAKSVPHAFMYTLNVTGFVLKLFFSDSCTHSSLSSHRRFKIYRLEAH